jgi:hypothetical protein
LFLSLGYAVAETWCVRGQGLGLGTYNGLSSNSRKYLLKHESLFFHSLSNIFRMSAMHQGSTYVAQHIIKTFMP